MTRYALISEWHLDAPVDRVWDTLLRSADWPAWWPAIRAVERLEAGDDQGVGMRLRQRWRGWLPYTMTLELEILHVEQQRLLVGRATGDMAGTCTFTFAERGGGTVVSFEMDVQPTKAWMDPPLPFVRSIVEGSFGAIMRDGSRGLRRRLAANDASVSHVARTASA
jgi:uncharacterized protein YndB with AHSA1/START domain